MVHVAVPHRSSVVTEWRRVVQGGLNRGRRRSRSAQDFTLEIELRVDDAQLQAQRRQRRSQQRERERDEKYLAVRISEAIVDGAAKKLADRLEEQLSAVDAHDDTRPCGLGTRREDRGHEDEREQD